MDATFAVVAEGLRKRYRDTHALTGFDLAVPAGKVCGLLGPNGAGKTTAVRILTTLRADGGRRAAPSCSPPSTWTRPTSSRAPSACSITAG